MVLTGGLEISSYSLLLNVYNISFHFLKLFQDELEQKWKKNEKWSKWKLGRAYSCPTSDLLSELKLTEDNSSDDEEDDEVFEQKNKYVKRDLLMAQTGIHLTYLGSLQVQKLLHKLILN